MDQNGLDDMDNRILLTIIEKFKGGPGGFVYYFNCLRRRVRYNRRSVRALPDSGGLPKTNRARGREVTEKAYIHLGIVPNFRTGELFG